MIVNLLKTTTLDWSEGGLIIRDANLLLNSFAHWSTRHVKRKVNSVAHNLARNALNFEHEVIDLENIPNCIRDPVMLDVSEL